MRTSGSARDGTFMPHDAYSFASRRSHSARCHSGAHMTTRNKGFTVTRGFVGMVRPGGRGTLGRAGLAIERGPGRVRTQWHMKG